jgi:hypothetical protein
MIPAVNCFAAIAVGGGGVKQASTSNPRSEGGPKNNRTWPRHALAAPPAAAVAWRVASVALRPRVRPSLFVYTFLCKYEFGVYIAYPSTRIPRSACARGMHARRRGASPLRAAISRAMMNLLRSGAGGSSRVRREIPIVNYGGTIP